MFTIAFAHCYKKGFKDGYLSNPYHRNVQDVGIHNKRLKVKLLFAQHTNNSYVVQKNNL